MLLGILAQLWEHPPRIWLLTLPVRKQSYFKLARIRPLCRAFIGILTLSMARVRFSHLVFTRLAL